MGEKIRDINKIRICGALFMVEKNKGTHGHGKYDIHIQNNKIRLNITEKDFIKIAACILYAEENLNSYKNRS